MSDTYVDLFCGSGGVTAGMEAAFLELGITPEASHAVNHWNLAVQVHAHNFPNVRVYQEDITEVTAATFGITGGRLIWGSPSCVHHSNARGGKPREEQDRSHAWEMYDRWLVPADFDVVIIENVPEFRDWGPLHETHSGICTGTETRCATRCHYHQPIKERKGEEFRKFVAALESIGYRVEWKILCCADYGDPTTRRRFFLQGVRDGRPITWPEPTHRNPKTPLGLFDPDLPPWRPASECIDWSLPMRSIFERKKPLRPNTLRRIAAGIDKYVLNGKPFVVNLTHGGRVEDLDEPFRTITGANRGEKAVVGAELLPIDGTPFVVNLRGTADDQVKGSASSTEEPLRTISAGGIHHGLAAAALIRYNSTFEGSPERVAGLVDPLGTLDTSNRYGLVAATLVGCGGRAGQSRPRGVDEPMATITTKGDTGIVVANLIGIDQGSSPSVWSLEEPLTTTTTKARHAVVAAFLTEYFGTGGAASLKDPLSTVTTKHRHGLVTVVIDGVTYAIVDILFRMLAPHELAKAHSLPDTYRFKRADGGKLTTAAKVKMIGNMVPVRTAQALIENVLRPRAGRHRRSA